MNKLILTELLIKRGAYVVYEDNSVNNMLNSSNGRYLVENYFI